MSKACLSCGSPTSRGRGTYCQKCYYAKRTGRVPRKRRGPWRFFCQQCGAKVSYGALHCAGCRRGHHKGPMNSNWDNFTDSSNPDVGRKRARHRMILKACEKCGQPATDRHHKDGNTFNNEPANLMALCRRCHMLIDGRLTRHDKQGKWRSK